MLTPTNSKRSHTGFLTGTVVVLLGIGLLLSQMGMVPADKIFRLWPLLLVWVGLGRLFEYRLCPHRAIWGVFVILTGVLLELNEFNIYAFHLHTLWPIFVIAGGLLIVWQSLAPRPSPPNPNAGAAANWVDYFQGRFHMNSDSSDLNAIAVLGGVKRNITSKKFRGGRVTAILGGVELDFIDADIEGDEAILDVSSLMGGVEIRVPDSWNVTIETVAFLAGSSDERRRAPVPAPGVTPKHLVIRGATILAGIEVKN
jgi:predicted membrane protein